MRITIQTKNIIPKVFLYCIATLPAVALLWQQNVLFFKLNWILYPFIIFAILFSISLRGRAPSVFYTFLGIFLLYSVYLIMMPTDWESIFRIFIALLPLTFIRVIQQNHDYTSYRIFWLLYFITICLPLVIAYLQYTERMPYYEYDAVNGETFGRISGGYNKPNNFISFLFPLYLFGFYRWQIQGKKIQGLFLIFFVLSVVYATGLRTAAIVFLSIFVSSFAFTKSSQLIYLYYKYYLNFFVGFLALLIIYFIFINAGFIDALRGRVPMWQAHANAFFNSSWYEALFGKGVVLLDKKYEGMKIIGSLSEVHNNTFRTLITFGLVGYFLYCSFMRWIVFHVFTSTGNARLRHIRLSCFIFLLLYSITNEPAYYSSVLWSILLWIFPVWEKKELMDAPVRNGHDDR